MSRVAEISASVTTNEPATAVDAGPRGGVRFTPRVGTRVAMILGPTAAGKTTFAIVTPVTAPNGEAADRTKVILKQEDNGTYELKSIWLEGQEFGFELE